MLEKARWRGQCGQALDQGYAEPGVLAVASGDHVAKRAGFHDEASAAKFRSLLSVRDSKEFAPTADTIFPGLQQALAFLKEVCWRHDALMLPDTQQWLRNRCCFHIDVSCCHGLGNTIAAQVMLICELSQKIKTCMTKDRNIAR